MKEKWNKFRVFLRWVDPRGKGWNLKLVAIVLLLLCCWACAMSVYLGFRAAYWTKERLA
jgi:hypothetical protein